MTRKGIEHGLCDIVDIVMAPSLREDACPNPRLEGAEGWPDKGHLPPHMGGYDLLQSTGLGRYPIDQNEGILALDLDAHTPST